jgi:RHS repeat-associated protein
MGLVPLFVYDELNPVQEKAGATVTANLLTGLGIDEFFTRTDGVGVRALLPDALGSTIALGDSTGTLQTQYTYEPFGYATQTGTASTSSYKYTGREDDGSGLYYYRARYYHPRLQRFISEDPIGLLSGSFNFYAYVDNNPTNGVDPFGLETAIVVNGPVASNPFGHTAIATTGSGVFSFGNNFDPSSPNHSYMGTSFTDYMIEQSLRRNSLVFILPTTADQELMINAFLRGRTSTPNTFPDNCVGRVTGALGAAGINLTEPYGPLQLPVQAIPHSLLVALQQMVGTGNATSMSVPQYTRVIPPALRSFNPR